MVSSPTNQISHMENFKFSQGLGSYINPLNHRSPRSCLNMLADFFRFAHMENSCGKRFDNPLGNKQINHTSIIHMHAR